MNKVFLIGNLTKDPEITDTPAGVPVCRFTIAVNRGDGENKTADFYNVTAWRALADAVAKYTVKGNKIAVVGDIQQRRYEGNDGITRISVDVQANEVEFLTPKQPAEPKEHFERQKPLRAAKAVQQKIEAFDDDGDIPF